MSLVERIYWIDGEIRAQHFPNADRVAARFEVSKRTAYKDRDYLRENLRAPLVFDRDHQGWTYTEPTWMLPFLALSDTEATTLRRSLLAVQEYLDPGDAAIAGQLFLRLSSHLLPSLPTETLGGAIHLLPHALPPPQLLTDCREAIRRTQRLHLRYYSIRRNEETERIVHPYHLHTFSGEPHLIAWCEKRQAIRQFLLGRIRAYVLLPKEGAFERQPDFDAEHYLRQGLQVQHGEEPECVRARFSAYQARWIRERQYHISQQLEEEADGSLLVTLRVGGTEEVKRWLLGFGAEVEVLEPAHLREEIAGEVKKMQKKYAVLRE